MQVWKLETDEDIRAAFSDPTVSIFGREIGSSNYENVKAGGHSYEDVVDATSHGFEFIASEGPNPPDVLKEEDAVFTEYTEDLD